MEVMGIAIAFLGIILTYIWRSNGKLQRSMMEVLSRIEEGQREMGRTLIEGQREIAAGQREIAAGQREIAVGQREIAQMLFNQTKILERIESKVG